MKQYCFFRGLSQESFPDRPKCHYVLLVCQFIPCFWCLLPVRPSPDRATPLHSLPAPLISSALIDLYALISLLFIATGQELSFLGDPAYVFSYGTVILASQTDFVLLGKTILTISFWMLAVRLCSPSRSALTFASCCIERSPARRRGVGLLVSIFGIGSNLLCYNFDFHINHQAESLIDFPRYF